MASIARLCCNAPLNIRNNRQFLTQQAAQLLIQAMVILLLTGHPAYVIKPLQMIQNAVTRLVLYLPKKARHPSVH